MCGLQSSKEPESKVILNVLIKGQLKVILKLGIPETVGGSAGVESPAHCAGSWGGIQPERGRG